MLGNGDIRSLYMFLVLFLLFIFRYDVPACGSRVPLVYAVYVVHVSLLFLSTMLLDISWMELWLMRITLIFIRIFGGRDWPGVGIGVPIRICCLFRPSAPRPYIRTGWSVVRQIDGPYQFFCRN